MEIEYERPEYFTVASSRAQVKANFIIFPHRNRYVSYIFLPWQNVSCFHNVNFSLLMHFFAYP